MWRHEVRGHSVLESTVKWDRGAHGGVTVWEEI